MTTPRESAEQAATTRLEPTGDNPSPEELLGYFGDDTTAGPDLRFGFGDAPKFMGTSPDEGGQQ